MIVSLVAAMDRAGGIGLDGRLPWRLSTDLKRFKALTLGHHLVMGRKTYESIARPLPGRIMVILSRNPDYQPPNCLTGDCIVVGNFEEALTLAEERGETELFVIGGAEVFRTALPIADRIYRTRVHAAIPVDVFFPNLDESLWTIAESNDFPADDQDQFPTTFQVLVRKRKV